MKIHQQEAANSEELLSDFRERVEKLAMDDDIDGIFLYIESKSMNNKSVFIIGQVEMDILASIIEAQSSEVDKESLN